MNADTEAAIDEVLMESFPASDPPPWTLGVTSQEADMKVRCRTVARVSAQYRNGMLRVTAPLAQPATKAEVEAA
ncbi:MAG TPA: hypothetical protein VI485_23570 [Vicinamibacterales bacterium]|nr:hypothetical protein [Vicinamibacterales bacterium]